MRWQIRTAAGLLALLGACGPPLHHTTDIETACASADARLAPTPRRVLALDTTFSHPWLPEQRRGCLVFASDTAGSAPVEVAVEGLLDLGWSEDGRLIADGPDGAMRGLRRDDLLCVLVGSWDGGNDSDSTYVPAPGYSLHLACWRALPKDASP